MLDTAEGNPHNFSLMSLDNTLQAANITILNQAVASYDGKIKFFIAQPSSSDGGWIKGTSSMLKRVEREPSVEEVEIEVQSITLNTFLRESNLQRCALWVDVEGAAYQVMDGASSVADRIVIGHVEVEDFSVWGEQKDATSVKILLESMGFQVIARGRGKNQHDIIL